MEFKDHYHTPCSLQCSSLAIYEEPGTSAVWLGVDDVEPKVLAQEAHIVGVDTRETTGWVPYPIPENVQLSARMHLDRKQVEALVNHLQAWLLTGQFRITSE